MSNNSKWFGGVLFGAVVGAVAGLLLAPKSGKETREDLKKEANRLREELDKYANDLSEKAEIYKEKLQEKLHETEAKLKEEFNNYSKESEEV